MPRRKKPASPPTTSEPEVEVLPAEQEPQERATPDLEIALDGDAIPVEAPEVEVEPEFAPGEMVRYDPFRAYLQEIAHHPILTREEEFALAVRYRSSGDPEAAYKLVVSNLKLVVMLAKEYQNAARNLLDLIQEGNMGLMEAVKNFDPYRNVRLPSYAAWWIKAYIIRYILANWRLVKIGTTQAQRKLFFNLQKEKEKLEREGFAPTPKLLAEKLAVKESEVLEMEQRLGSPDVSVDAPLGSEDEEATLLSFLPASGLNAEQLAERKELRQMVKAAFTEFTATLDERERVIFRDRLLHEDKSTLEDVAQRFSLSRERIRQLENRIKDKLKRFLLDKFGTAISVGDIEVSEP